MLQLAIDNLLSPPVLGFTLGLLAVAIGGEGPRNRRVSDLEGGNVRIETLVSHATADAIMAKPATDWFPHSAVVAWVTDLEVAREDRYLQPADTRPEGPEPTRGFEPRTPSLRVMCSTN